MTDLEIWKLCCKEYEKIKKENLITQDYIKYIVMINIIHFKTLKETVKYESDCKKNYNLKQYIYELHNLMRDNIKE